jgi:hypothetical protein
VEFERGDKGTRFPDPDFGEEDCSMGFIQVAQRRFGIAGELISFFARNKRWWMLPMILVVLLLGVLLILAQSSVIAPFIYTLF